VFESSSVELAEGDWHRVSLFVNPIEDIDDREKFNKSLDEWREQVNFVCAPEMQSHHTVLARWVLGLIAEFQERFRSVFVDDVGFNPDQGIVWLLPKIGYWSAAHCELLAERKSLAGAPTNQGSGDKQAEQDGIDEIRRIMIWGGELYQNIPPRAIKVLKLLLDRYKKNDPDQSIVELKEIIELDYSVDGGMVSQVFKNHPVKKIVELVGKGRYRLKNPD
jgi:hypothetical protein